MSLSKEELKATFEKAREMKMPYVFVAIRAEGVDEAIVIPERSFDEKEKFYLDAYTDDLKHVMNKNVFIRGLSFGSEKELSRII